MTKVQATHSHTNQAESLEHPGVGPSTRQRKFVAIRWKKDSGGRARTQVLLDAHNLELAVLRPTEPNSLVRVNQTDGLSWVRKKDGEAIGDELISELEGSASVEWVAPAFQAADVARFAARTPTGQPQEAQVFAIHPRRLYVEKHAFDHAGGAVALGASVTVDLDRSSRLRGYVALTIPTGSYASASNAIEAARAARNAVAKARGARTTQESDVKFETIPFLSPTCELPTRNPLASITPDDPFFGQQWGLQRINAPAGWEIAKGSPSVTVAVIDEGVQLDHPDLLLHPQSWNASTDLPDGSPTGSHGTACAGIIGARFNNAAGIAGVAAGVKVMAIATATWADVDVAEGLYFAADNGARVVSMSFGVYDGWGWDLQLVRDALQYAYDRGLLLVAACGNENAPLARFPGSDARTLCVGGANRSDERKRVNDTSSETFWGASYGPDVDVVAPCLEIPTTDRLGADGYDGGDYYARFNGTSAATPHVAGLGALLFSLDPALSNVAVRSVIERSCDKISPSLYAYAHVLAKPSGTWHEEVGYGRINIARALLELRPAPKECGEDCSGCGGTCLESTPKQCRAPRPVPWLPFDRCQFFYERRHFEIGPVNDRPLRIRVTYEHCLRLLGRQQGPLLYTTTLLPGEALRVFEFDRYRRTKTAEQRLSVHSSFRQTLSALSSSRRATSASTYAETLSAIRTSSDTSVSVGGGLVGLLGGPEGSAKNEREAETTLASGASLNTASEQFTQLAVIASQAVDAERSMSISTFEEQEHQATTARTLKNTNHCYAVTYFVRRVNEVYESSSRIEDVEWQWGDGPFRRLSDTDGENDSKSRLLENLREVLPKIGGGRRDRRCITLPTDGALYEAELAHCASCDPVQEAEDKMRAEQMRLATRRTCLEVELLALEIERRRELLGSQAAPALALSTWNVSGAPSVPEPVEHTRLLPA